MAARLKAPQATPYTVSVGTTTTPPEASVSAQSSSADGWIRPSMRRWTRVASFCAPRRPFISSGAVTGIDADILSGEVACLVVGPLVAEAEIDADNDPLFL